MTPDELVKKIKEILDAQTPLFYTPMERWKDIESLLTEALAEAMEKNSEIAIENWISLDKVKWEKEVKATAYEDGKQEGYKNRWQELKIKQLDAKKEAYEEAAKIAESGDCDVELWDAQAKAAAEAIAKDIRRRAEEMK